MREASVMWCATSVACAGTSVINAFALLQTLIVIQQIGIRHQDILVLVVMLLEMNKGKLHFIMVATISMGTS